MPTLKDHQSLILLDGYNDLSDEQDSLDTTEQRNSNEEDILTVHDLLRNTYNSKYSKMKVWITSG